MTQLTYTKDELLQEHDYARLNQVGDRRLHGGFDADGSYISPRTARRWEAVHNWEDALRKRGGEPLVRAHEAMKVERAPV